MGTESQAGQEQRFEMGPRSELSVSNVSGRISVVAQAGSEIVVRHDKRGASRALQNTNVDIRREGNRVTVQTRSVAGGLINFGRASSVNYDITVPTDCTVRLHAVSASISLGGLRADAAIQTVSGDVNATDLAGDISITTVSGKIVASNLSGTLVARTTSGDGSILMSRLRRFSVNSVSGDFSLETPLIVDEHCNAKTVSGDLELRLPPETGATIQLKSISGSVSCELPAEIIKSGRRHWQGRVNGGGGHVEMNSVSGDLTIRRSQGVRMESDSDDVADESRAHWPQEPPSKPLVPEPPSSPMIPEPATVSSIPEFVHAAEPTVPGESAKDAELFSESPDSTTATLQALERGEITVDEAMARLEG